jgi:hypothetical protein
VRLNGYWCASSVLWIPTLEVLCKSGIYALPLFSY